MHFFETWSQGGKSENAALAFSCGRQICILCISMMQSPQPSTSSLRPLNSVTSHNNNNNNNGSSATMLSKKGLWTMDLPCSSSFCLVSPSTVCLYTARKLYAQAPSLLLCFGWISSATYRIEYELQRVESFTMNPFGHKYSWNDAKEAGGKKDCFSTCGHGLRVGRATCGLLTQLAFMWVGKARWAQVWMVVKLSGQRTQCCIVGGS